MALRGHYLWGIYKRRPATRGEGVVSIVTLCKKNTNFYTIKTFGRFCLFQTLIFFRQLKLQIKMLSMKYFSKKAPTTRCRLHTSMDCSSETKNCEKAKIQANVG